MNKLLAAMIMKNCDCKECNCKNCDCKNCKCCEDN